MSCIAGSISNGYTISSVNLFNVNETVTYSCNTFYTLSGNAVATCLDVNGTWSARPTCKLTFYDNVWFWMTVGLISLIALILLLLLLIFLIRYCCCHRKRTHVSEMSHSEDRYGDSCGPCCGFVDYKGCCSLYGCCGFYGCMGSCCGCCRCCREFPNENNDSNRNNNNRHSTESNKPAKKKKVAARHTQTSPTPTDSTMALDEKKKTAKVLTVWMPHTHNKRSINTSTK